MKISFRTENGSCPKWEHEGLRYYLFEDYYGDGSWTLMSQKIGFLKKDRFYGEGPKRIHPRALLERFFKEKSVRYERSGEYSFWIWNGRRFVTDGKTIMIMYEKKY